MKRRLPFLFAALSLATSAIAQRVACIGAPFAFCEVADARQGFDNALRWRLPTGCEVRSGAQLDASLTDWQPEVIVVAHSDPRSQVPAPIEGRRWIDVSTRIREHALPADRLRDPFQADRLAAIVAEAVTGMRAAVTTTPLPSPEHRAAAAGWGKGSWWDQHEGLRRCAETHRDLDIVFLGDSITQGLTGVEDRLARPAGSRAFDRHFGSARAAAFGIAGDRTQHLLFRLRQGEIATLRPKVIVVQIGINNVSAGDDPREIAAGIEAIVAELRATQPQASVLVCGPFPAGRTADSPARRVVAAIHARLRRWPREEQVIHRDLAALFLDPDGTPRATLAGDHLHVSESGRDAWLRAIARLVRSLRT